jgi:hypothetical protein
MGHAVAHPGNRQADGVIRDWIVNTLLDPAATDDEIFAAVGVAAPTQL